MKKFVSVLLAMMLAVSVFAGCSGGNAEPTVPETAAPTVPETEAPAVPETEAPTEAPAEPGEEAEGLAAIIDKIYEQQPVELAVGTMPVDVTDTSEEGLWALKRFTGLDSAEGITEAAVSEAMIGSQAYSMVLVRVADAANAKNVAEAMKGGIDQRKWICVEADDMLVSGYGDVVMLIMVSSVFAENGLTAQSMTDAFAAVCGGELDFTLA